MRLHANMISLTNLSGPSCTVLAERAAWAFVEKNKDAIKFDLVTILPVLVYGVSLHYFSPQYGLNKD